MILFGAGVALGIVVGGLVVCAVMALLERDSGAKGYVDLSRRP